MLFNQSDIISALLSHNIEVNGCLHIGAHECEELGFYNNLGLKNEDVIWIDAILSKVH